jgi:outer membrane lipopolysaccharide assembly protein LptE/RlpB
MDGVTAIQVQILKTQTTKISCQNHLRFAVSLSLTQNTVEVEEEETNIYQLRSNMTPTKLATVTILTPDLVYESQLFQFRNK